MLSYRHSYHAGNHADVLKHWVLELCLQHLKRKEKPFSYIDTHAGAGRYSLKSAHANKTGEYEMGIARLWLADSLPETFAGYLAQVKAINSGNKLSNYPGSPEIAANLLRPQDALRLMERHSTDYELLSVNLGNDTRAKLFFGDGFAELKALLPPPSRRGLILMDPSYEEKQDYQRVLSSLSDGLQRFATGVYLVWYPLINSVWAQSFTKKLTTLSDRPWLDIQLIVKSPPPGHGMYGSGMFVINPPWRLSEQVSEGLPVLKKLLGQDDSADIKLNLNS